MSTRRGSFLVVCMGLMVLMVILAYMIVHDIRLQSATSTSNQRYLLAEAAARAGLNHATEQILIDYCQPTMSVRDQAAGTAKVPAITFLDGQYRAPFLAISNPDQTIYSLDSNAPTTDDDVRLEDSVLRPWAWWWNENTTWWTSGLLMYDGRGRYYEPGYYNTAPSAVTSGTPNVATPFLDSDAPVPDRSQAMFYDENYQRIVPSGNPALDRQNARFRLRYAVGVEDLSGHLLINPIPDMQMLAGTTQAVDYRTPAATYPWMTTATNAIASIAGTVTSPTFGAQLENAFQGRGYWTNVDFDQSPHGGMVGFPKTFPLMYRTHPEWNPASESWQGSGNWEGWIDGANATGSLTNSLFWLCTGNAQSPQPDAGPVGKAEGGEPIPPHYCSGSGLSSYYQDATGMIFHCLMGPQLSFDNLTYAIEGELPGLGSPISGGNQIQWGKFGLTPFGRGLTTSGYHPYQTGNRWYQGRVDTPFYVNLMTAPPTVIDAMLMAYLPPREKVFRFTGVLWQRYNNVQDTGIWTTIRTDAIDPTNTLNQASAYGRDLLVDTSAPPCFAQWPAPSRSDANPYGANNPPDAQGQYIKPDYYANDVRDPSTMYPGPFMNGSSSTTGQGSDDLGLNMDEQAQLDWLHNGDSYGLDPYTGQPFVTYSAGNPQHYCSNFGGWTPTNNPVANAVSWATTANAPAGWGTTDPFPGNDLVTKVPDPTLVLHVHSYYWDMLAGMGVAISVLRAEYIQYNQYWINAGSIFGKPQAGQQGDPDPTSCETLRDLDRIFLSEMGESIDAPGSGSPQQMGLNAYRIHYNGVQPIFTRDYVPANNIFSLVHASLLSNADNSVTSIQRGHVMELLLNDFRMSFLGSSPGYSDITTSGMEFRPLDFLGDGMAYCSCYGASVDKDGLPCAPVGTKPPNYFTITGNFFLGKSHFYRVFSRGEIWDNLMGVRLNDATLDSVLCVDPEGVDPTQTQTLYQRWFYNRYNAMLPAIKR